MNYQNITLQSTNISRLITQGQPNILKEGSSVFVKVIADKGNGVYEGSVAGHRVHINSSKTLQIGSSFVASISAKNGTIYITPKNLSTINNKAYLQINAFNQTQLSSLLARLGVPINQLSGDILKMMMQLEMKIDKDVLHNIFIKASHYKGKEKAIGELLVLLKDNNIELSNEEIEALLSYLETSYDDLEDSKDKKQYKNEKDIINQINKKEDGWTIVPYNLVNKEDNNVIGCGVLRILKTKYKELKRININCYFNDKEYIFSLLFEKKQCKEIKFNINPQDKSNEYYEKALGNFFHNKELSITFTDPSLIEGFSSEDEKIYSFEGEA